MKSDDEIFSELSRYRPVGPPARLRDRVVQVKSPARTWPWAVAAAALLALSVALNAGARRIEADTAVLVPARTPPPDPFGELPAGLRAMAEREAFLTRLEQGDSREPVDPMERR
jgi:hypothetical protein